MKEIYFININFKIYKKKHNYLHNKNKNIKAIQREKQCKYCKYYESSSESQL